MNEGMELRAACAREKVVVAAVEIVTEVVVV